MLSTAVAAEIAGAPVATAKKSYKPDVKYPETEVITYSWNNGRKRKAGPIEVLVEDTVKFGWLRKSDLATMEGKLANPAFKGLLEKVEGLGDYALWNSRDKQLMVLRGKSEFSIWINLSADDASNKAKSIALAKIMVEKL